MYAFAFLSGLKPINMAGLCGSAGKGACCSRLMTEFDPQNLQKKRRTGSTKLSSDMCTVCTYAPIICTQSLTVIVDRIRIRSILEGDEHLLYLLLCVPTLAKSNVSAWLIYPFPDGLFILLGLSFLFSVSPVSSFFYPTCSRVCLLSHAGLGARVVWIEYKCPTAEQHPLAEMLIFFFLFLSPLLQLRDITL